MQSKFAGLAADSYKRFSSGEQKEGDSERRQNDMTAGFIKRWGLNPSADLWDRGLSGFHMTNVTEGKLGEYLELIRQKAIVGPRVLVIEQLNRLVRGRPDKAVAILTQILEAGIHLGVCVFEDVITVDDLGTWKWNQLSGAILQAHMDSKQKSDWKKQSNKAKRDAAYEGKKHNHTCPHWIRWDSTKKDFVEKEDPWNMMQKAVALKLQGYGNHEIRQKCGMSDDEWGGLACMFRNRTLIGEYHPHQKIDGRKVFDERGPIKDYYPAIVAEATFYKLQEAIDRNITNDKPKGGKRGLFLNLFTGLLTGKTGELVMKTASRKHSKWGKQLVFNSRTQKEVLYYVPLENAILGTIKDKLTPADLQPLQAEMKTREDELYRDLGRVNRKLEELETAFNDDEDGEKDAAWLKKWVRPLQVKKTELQARLDDLKRSMALNRKDVVGECKTVIEMLEKASPEKRHELRTKLKGMMATIIKSVAVDRQDREHAKLTVWLNKEQNPRMAAYKDTPWAEIGVAGETFTCTGNGVIRFSKATA